MKSYTQVKKQTEQTEQIFKHLSDNRYQRGV
jgi:hypothetical protein